MYRSLHVADSAIARVGRVLDEFNEAATREAERTGVRVPRALTADRVSAARRYEALAWLRFAAAAAGT